MEGTNCYFIIITYTNYLHKYIFNKSNTYKDDLHFKKNINLTLYKIIKD